MGMYTEFYFRSFFPKDVDPRLLDWFEHGSDASYVDLEPFEPHPFFEADRWQSVLYGGGAVYQISRPPHLHRGNPDHSWDYSTLEIHSSFKNYGGEIDLFLEWITPYLAAYPGDLLGFSLYEESRSNGYSDHDQDRPTLHFMPSDRKGVR